MNTINARNVQLMGAFETLKRELLDDAYRDRLDAPLALWTVASDRRLPIAFLNWSLRDLLQTPYAELRETPGIGEKKLESLVMLLRRARDAEPLEPKIVPPPSEPTNHSENGAPAAPFDPSQMSEIMWAQCRETVRRLDLGDLKLGQVAVSLESIPTVIWTVPLSTYLPYTIAEMRQLKTHGEKRVRIILEIFHQLHQIFGNVPLDAHLRIRPAPAFVRPLEDWLRGQLSAERPAAAREIIENLGAPIVHQIRIDRGATVAEVAAERVGVEGSPESVRAQSRRMGVTRARIYQLLDEAAQVFVVRWPEGCNLMRNYHEHLERSGGSPEALDALETIQELCYPAKAYDNGELRPTPLRPDATNRPSTRRLPAQAARRDP